jgi:hypothetical protein
VIYQSTVTLESGASLDLSATMIVQNSDFGAIEASVRKGLNGGDWLGKGITSSAAAGDPDHATALGMADHDGDVLLKYTYYGDADLDGRVDGEDFDDFLHGYEQAVAEWVEGDFNYSGMADAEDFGLLVRGLAGQGRGVSGELFNALSDFVRAEGLSVDLTAVPEPAGLAVVATALVFMRGLGVSPELRRSRRKIASLERSAETAKPRGEFL